MSSGQVCYPPGEVHVSELNVELPCRNTGVGGSELPRCVRAVKGSDSLSLVSCRVFCLLICFVGLVAGL